MNKLDSGPYPIMHIYNYTNYENFLVLSYQLLRWNASYCPRTPIVVVGANQIPDGNCYGDRGSLKAFKLRFLLPSFDPELTEKLKAYLHGAPGCCSHVHPLCSPLYHFSLGAVA